MEQVRKRYDGEVAFVCGYEAGCLGYSLYHQLNDHEVDCKILAPTTMAITNTNHVKTDKRDAIVTKVLDIGLVYKLKFSFIF